MGDVPIGCTAEVGNIRSSDMSKMIRVRLKGHRRKKDHSTEARVYLCKGLTVIPTGTISPAARSKLD